MASAKDTIQKRASRVRRQIKAVANGRPRLSVHRTSKNIYAQIIDDAQGKTLAAASTLDADFKTGQKDRRRFRRRFACRQTGCRAREEGGRV